VIGEPRGFGTDHETVAEPPAAPTETDETASGKPAGTTAADNADESEEPEAFEAFTLKRYDVPFTKPVTVHDVSVVEQVAPPGNEVITKLVIAAPPSLSGAAHDTTD